MFKPAYPVRKRKELRAPEWRVFMFSTESTIEVSGMMLGYVQSEGAKIKVSFVYEIKFGRSVREKK